MILAESLPDPHTASSIGWWLVIAAAVIAGLNQGIRFADRLTGRKQEITPQPLAVTGTPISNAEIARDLKNMNHRLVALENWRSEVLRKMESDKTEILAAGEHRAEKIHDRINEVLVAVSELKGTVSELRREN